MQRQELAEKPAFIFFIAVVLYAQYSGATSNCGERFSTRMDQDVFSKHRFRSRVIESQSIIRPLECYVRCMKNCRCVSYNICNGGKMCELNSEKKADNISLFEASDECDYHEYEFNKQDATGSCLDSCCSTSQPCLHNGTCQSTCMNNGHRFTCQECADGFEGNRCEKVPRSCAGYNNSPNRQIGNTKKIIYAPGNTPYEVFCLFTETEARTLVMSFSRSNSPGISGHSLAEDNPKNEDAFVWENYRLSLARMEGIRNNSTQWFYTCNFNVLSWSWEDCLQSYFNITDPLTYDSSAVDECRSVTFVSIRGKQCWNCRVGMTQTSGSIFRVEDQNVNCGGLDVHQYTCSKNNVPVTYFGDYTCYISSFKCSGGGAVTTQLWFSD